MAIELLVFQMCAVCIGFDGHICPFVDGVEQFWNCDEQWTVMVIPEILIWYSTDHSMFVNGQWWDDGREPMIVIGGSKLMDEFGYSVFTHEVRHLQCRCNYHA